LSETLKEEWNRRHPRKPYTKEDLQNLGNELRREYSLAYLADKTCEKATKDGNQRKDIVFDSIRNPAEIGFLKGKFADFYVIAVDCAEVDRWDRVKNKDYLNKGLTYENFKKDDARDKNEEGIVYGQQVALCVDEADYLIRNDSDLMVTSEPAYKRILRGKLEDPISLFRGESRLPNKSETYMSIAYTASLMSECIKRQVGAVIIDKSGNVVSMGYNINPSPLKPCYKQFGDCYREIAISEIMSAVNNCPSCGKELDGLEYPYTCPHCKVSVYRKIISDRAIGRCMALHAEEKALANADSTNLRNCTMFVTTFPCFHCAQQILDAGIGRLYYVESYPDLDAVKLFNSAKSLERSIKIQKFEGVKARAYVRFFSSWRRNREAELIESRMR